MIAGGGGGIPVYRAAQGELRGVEAVIDKDYTAGLIASELRADLFVILTGVDQVSLNYSKIEFEYKEQKADGSLGGAVKAGYDLKANKKV